MVGIEILEVEGFRGIGPRRVLSFEGKSVLLFGENGTGKTSFVDALEMLFTGEVTPLERAQGLSTSQHGKNICRKRTVIKATLTDGSEVSLENGQTPETPTAENYLAAAVQPRYILRRRQILDFIENPPKDRYEMLEPFLPLGEVMNIEQALRDAAKAAKSECDEARERMLTLARRIAGALGIPTPGQDISESTVCQAISSLLKSTGIGTLRSISELETARSSVDGKLKSLGDFEEANHIRNILSAVETLIKTLSDVHMAPLVSPLQEMWRFQRDVGAAFFEDVLERGLKWIRAEELDFCPLCGTRWDTKPRDRNALVKRIESELREMKGLIASRRCVIDAQRMLIDKINAANAASNSLKVLLEGLGRGEDVSHLDRIVASLGSLRDITQCRPDEMSPDKLHVVTDAWDDVRWEPSLRELAQRYEQVSASLPKLEDVEPLTRLYGLLGQIQELWGERESVLKTLEEATRDHEVKRRALLRAEEARKEVVQELFKKLDKEINNLYKRIDSDPERGNIRLELREATRGGVRLWKKFYDHDGSDPRAYENDARLDCLGLSIFLALRRFYRDEHSDFNLLVLDDVLTSIDTQHTVAVAELILKEFADYQILLTTHDRIWYEHLRDIQARCGVKSRFVNKAIHNWTLTEGPDLSEPDDESSHLERLIADASSPESVQDAAGAAGRLLEHILQEMRYSLRLSVQAKREERYGIGEIWPSFYKKAQGRYPGLYQKCQGTLDALNIRWPIRNWVGAHFNDWASRVGNQDGLNFARSVGALFKCVFCDECRRFIQPSMAPAGQLSCRCGHLLYPVPGKEAVKPVSREDLVKASAGAFKDARLDTELYLRWKREEAVAESN